MPKQQRAKRFRKGKGKPAQVKKIEQIAKRIMIKSFPKREIRYQPSKVALNTGTVPTNNFDNIWLTNIAMGDQVNQRHGDKIYVKGVSFTYTFHNSHTAARGIRFMLVKNNNRSGDTLDTASYTDLYQNVAFGDRTVDGKAGDFTAPLNNDVVKVYCDLKLVVPPATMRDTVITKYCPIKDYVLFDGSGISTDHTSGKLYLIIELCELDNTTPNSTNLHMFGDTRLFYRDA